MKMINFIELLKELKLEFLKEKRDFRKQIQDKSFLIKVTGI